MIKILKTLRKEKGLCLIVTELDAKAANIDRDYEKDVIDYRLEEHLIKLSDHVDNDTVIKCLKEFLIESVFTHYIDMVGILNYIYAIRNVIKVMKKHPSHSKFLFTTEFKNYISDQSDNDDKLDNDEEDSTFFGISLNTDLLRRNNLKCIERIMFITLNDMYEENVLLSKPKEVKMFLKERETPKGTKEVFHMDMFFYKPDKTK